MVKRTKLKSEKFYLKNSAKNLNKYFSEYPRKEVNLTF